MASTRKGAWPIQSSWLTTTDVINDDDFCDVDHPLRKILQNFLFGAETANFTYNGNGGAATSGSVDKYHWSNYDGYGTATTSGSADKYHWSNYTGSGTATTSGFAPTYGTKVYETSGSSATSGFAPTQIGYAYNPAGAGKASTSGLATTSLDTKNFIYNATGTVNTSGFAPNFGNRLVAYLPINYFTNYKPYIPTFYFSDIKYFIFNGTGRVNTSGSSADVTTENVPLIIPIFLNSKGILFGTLASSQTDVILSQNNSLVAKGILYSPTVKLTANLIYNATGSALTSGFAPTSKTVTSSDFVYNATGTATTSGSADKYHWSVYTGSGTATTSGSADKYHWSNYTGNGTATSSGFAVTSVDTKNFIYNTTGSSATTGLATTSIDTKNFIYNATGTATTSGSADKYHWSVYTGSGTATTSGLATTSVDTKNFIYNTTGTATTSGFAVTSVDTKNFIYNATGSSATTGSADKYHWSVYTGSGTATTSGFAVTSVDTKNFIYNATGTATTSGFAQTEGTYSKTYNATGTATTSGFAVTSVDTKNFIYNATGTAITSGFADKYHWSNYTGSGTATTSGFAVTVGYITAVYNTTGTSNTSGIATAAFYYNKMVASTFKGSDTALTTDPVDTTGANFLVVLIVQGGAPPSSGYFSDNKSNTWHFLTVYGSGGYCSVIAYAYNANVGSGHTFTYSEANNFPAIFAYAFSGMDTTSAVYDASNGAASGTTGNITPAESGELLIAGMCNSVAATYSVDGTWSIRNQLAWGSGTNPGGAVAFIDPYNSVVAVGATWSGGTPQSSTIAAFKFLSFNYKATGTATTSGFAVTSVDTKNFIYNATGTATTSGFADKYHWSNYTGSGTATTSGFGSTQGAVYTRTYEPIGSILTSGVAVAFLMKFAFISSSYNENDGAASTLSTNSTFNLQAGDLLVASIRWYGTSTTSTIGAVGGGDSFSLMTLMSNSGSYFQMGYCISTSANASATIQFTLGAVQNYLGMLVLQFRPTTGYATLYDVGDAYATGIGTAIQSGNITTTETNELVVGGLFTQSYITPSNIYIAGVAPDGYYQDQSVGSGNIVVTMPYTFFGTKQTSISAQETVASSSVWGADIVAFKTLVSFNYVGSGTTITSGSADKYHWSNYTGSGTATTSGIAQTITATTLSYFGYQAGIDQLSIAAAFARKEAGYVCPGTGSQAVKEFSVQVYSGTANLRLGIYNVAGNLILQTSKKATTGPGWLSWADSELTWFIQSTLTAGTTYRLAIANDTGFIISGNAGAGTLNYNLGDYTAALPDPEPASSTTTCEYNIKCGVTSTAYTMACTGLGSITTSGTAQSLIGYKNHIYNTTGTATTSGGAEYIGPARLYNTSGGVLTSGTANYVMPKFTFIATAQAVVEGSTTTADCTSTLNIQAGDLLVAMSRWYPSPLLSSIAETSGANNFTLLTLLNNGASGHYEQMGYKIAATANANATIRGTWNDLTIYKNLIVFQFRPIAGYSVSLDQNVSTSNSGLTWQTPNITTTDLNEVACAMVAHYPYENYPAVQIAGIAADLYVNGPAGSYGLGQLSYSIFTSIQTNIYATGTFASQSNLWGCQIISFKALAEHIYNPTGTVNTSGSATTVGVTNPVYNATGTVNTSGFATTLEFNNYVYEPRGSALTSGFASFSRDTIYNATGTVTTSGFATTIGSITTIWNSIGTINTSGLANTIELDVYPYNPVGGVNTSGTAQTIHSDYIYNPSGRVLTSGFALISSVNAPFRLTTLVGKGILFGTVTATQNGVTLNQNTSLKNIGKIYTPTVVIYPTKIYIARGGVATSGIAVTNFRNYAYTGSGRVNTSGFARTIFNNFFGSVSGRVLTSGSAITIGPYKPIGYWPIRYWAAYWPIHYWPDLMPYTNYTYEPSGVVITSGFAGTIGPVVRTYEPSGRVLTSGSALVTRDFTYNPSGRVNTSGFATTSFHSYDFIYNPIGRVLTSGFALIISINAPIRLTTLIAKGILFGTLVGTDIYLKPNMAISSIGKLYSPTVTITATGYTYIATGRVLTSGFATTITSTYAKTYNPTGGVLTSKFAPTSIDTKNFIYNAIGRVNTSGFATTIVSKNYIYNPTGTINTSGFATTIVSKNYIYIATGTATTSKFAPTSLSTKYFIYNAEIAKVNISGFAITILDTKNFLYNTTGIVNTSGLAGTIGYITAIYNPSGRVLTSGFATTLIGISNPIYNATGIVNTSGFATTQIGYIYNVTGRVLTSKFAPTSVDTKNFIYNGTGRILTSSFATTYVSSTNIIYIATGRVNTSGFATTSVDTKNFIYIATGRVNTSGFATTSVDTKNFIYIATGRVNTSGFATTNKNIYSQTYIATGRVNTSGFASTFVSKNYTYEPRGSALTSGFAKTLINTKNFIYETSGTVFTSGTLILVISFYVVFYKGIGTVTTSGFATTLINTKNFIYHVTGTINTSGFANTSLETRNFIYNGTGRILTSGSAVVTTSVFIQAYTSTVIVRTSGKARTFVDTKNFIYETTGTVNTSGFARTAGFALYTFNTTGTINTSGTAQYQQGFIYRGSGIVRTSGKANSIGYTTAEYIGIGTVRTSGFAPTGKNEHSYMGNGIVHTSGFAKTSRKRKHFISFTEVAGDTSINYFNLFTGKVKVGSTEVRKLLKGKNSGREGDFNYFDEFTKGDGRKE